MCEHLLGSGLILSVMETWRHLLTNLQVEVDRETSEERSVVKVGHVEAAAVCKHSYCRACAFCRAMTASSS